MSKPNRSKNSVYGRQTAIVALTAAEAVADIVREKRLLNADGSDYDPRVDERAGALSIIAQACTQLSDLGMSFQDVVDLDTGAGDLEELYEGTWGELSDPDTADPAAHPPVAPIDFDEEVIPAEFSKLFALLKREGQK